MHLTWKQNRYWRFKKTNQTSRTPLGYETPSEIFWSQCLRSYLIFYFFDGRSPSGYKQSKTSFNRCLNGRFPLRNCFINTLVYQPKWEYWQWQIFSSELNSQIPNREFFTGVLRSLYCFWKDLITSICFSGSLIIV